MTPYERGFADCRERAAKVCRLEAAMVSGTGRLSHHAKMLGERILSLQPEAGADQRGTGEDSRAEQSCENRAPHHNPGEQVSSVENPDSLSVGARPARPGPCVSVPVAMLEKWKDAIAPYWFSSDGEDEYNNDGVIEVSEEISELIAAAKEE
jgi:hypothetical protein